MTGTLPTGVTFTRASTATYFDNTGTMQTAAANVPRYDYNPSTLALNGLLIEESRTNSVRNSSNVGAVVGTPGTLPTNWATLLNGLVISVVAVGTTNGMPSIDVRFAGTATGGVCILNFDTSFIAIAAGQSWRLSCYIALVGGTMANVTSINLAGRASAGSWSDTPFTPTATLTRVVSPQSPTATGTVNPAIDVYFNTGAVINFTLRICAVQHELGAFPTSFIPTTSAAVTRSADVATIPVGGWYNAATGTLQAEFIYAGQITGGYDSVIAMVGANSNTDFIEIYAQQTNGQLFGYIKVSGTATGSAGSAVLLTTGVVAKSAVTYSTTTVGGANGGAVWTPSSVTGGLPAITALWFMQPSVNYQNQMSGWMRRVRYWPRVLTNTELQQVTT